MSFGNQTGPPASDKQVAYLLSLVRQAGHEGFRDARHPLGLTQRQAAGKFSGREASALIDRLLGGDDAGPGGSPTDPAAERLEGERAAVVRGLPADVLAAELCRRGWTVHAP
jgi:hypothetical protein